ncbi:phosphotransferase [Spiroplasma turonicum]|uniref:Putative choline kinase n=1 Tax=Spiroplasma turonicum TaxID=216946 RepID=A0A0K1P5K1_9MOLU|nr:phosphotransferase [Spiroplasma turonicum]AKU79591.1 putative choline kinase [Spiroplasma turonicum]ALX70613.1 putative choline kinase [Spiroplasma turonicum]
MKNNKFNGYTNKIKLKNNKIIKTYKIKKDDYLDKLNEFIVLTIFKEMEQDVIIKPIEILYKKNKLISSFVYLKDYNDLSNLKLNNVNIDFITKLIKSFHSIKNDNFHKVKTFNYSKTLNFFIKNLKKPFCNLDKITYEIIVELDKLKGSKKVISHNDLVPGNILFNNNKYLFIDYDYVMMNYKYFDYASLITETLNEDEKSINYFIDNLIKNKMLLPIQSEFDKLNIIIRYQDLLWSLWANYMFEKTKKEIFHKIYKDKYERLKKRIIITF